MRKRDKKGLILLRELQSKWAKWYQNLMNKFKRRTKNNQKGKVSQKQRLILRIKRIIFDSIYV